MKPRQTLNAYLRTFRFHDAPEPPGQVVQVIRCATCNGSGQRRFELPIGTERGETYTVYRTCPACNGSGTAAERIVPVGPEPFPLARD